MIPSMRHGLAGGLLLLCSLAFPGGSYCQEPPYIYRFGVKVEMVSIFATVLDRAGRLVTGLNRDDFAVYDNGERQAISQFSREYIPVSVVILLDTSSSMLSGKKLDNAKKARAQFQETVNRLQIAGVELFAIGIESSLPEDLQDKAVTRSILEQLTKSAGGESFALSDPKHLGSICGTISERIHNQYTFGYYPSPLLDSRWHGVRIETRVPGLRVVASKTGYYPVIDREARSR